MDIQKEKIGEGVFVQELSEAEELVTINAQPKAFQQHAQQQAHSAANSHESLMYNAITKELESRRLFSSKSLIDKKERAQIIDNTIEDAFDAMLKTRLDYEFSQLQNSFERYINERLPKRFYELLRNHDKMLEQQGYLLTPEALQEQGYEPLTNEEEKMPTNEKQHKGNSSLIVKSGEAMMSLIEIYRKMPKDIKPSFGKTLVDAYLQYYLSITKAYKMYNKETSLKNADIYLFQYELMIEAMHKNKIISDKESNIIIQQTTELGRMLGGWIKAEKKKQNTK